MTDKPSGPCCKHTQKAIQTRNVWTQAPTPLTRAGKTLIRKRTRAGATSHMGNAPCAVTGIKRQIMNHAGLEGQTVMRGGESDGDAAA
jgi:hypothetical protein